MRRGKNMLEKIRRYISDKECRFMFHKGLGLYNHMPDKAFLKLAYKAHMGSELHLDHPITFNEKLQWLKLYDRKPEYTKMADKYEAKKYIADKIGAEYVIPALGVWNKFEEIDFDKLPNQFVLKCTHDSGGLVLCKDKKDLDIEACRKKLEKSLRSNYYLNGREWPYKNVKPRIIAEKYMFEDNTGWLTDYKFFCFHGVPKILYVSKDKAEFPTTDFFDMDYNRLHMRMKDPNSQVPPPKPDQFETMKELAEKLSEGIPHIRVDFYYIQNRIYVGELTFYHYSGFAKIQPEEWAIKMGDWIQIH